MHHPPRILIVDDSEANRDILSARLAPHGYELMQAADGEEALAAARERAPDLILLDVMMPKLDGIAVVDQLRKDNNPVLAHTYLLTAGNSNTVKDLPVRGLIEKPFDLHALLAETKDCIGH
jgi:adenylate cyclase